MKAAILFILMSVTAFNTAIAQKDLESDTNELSVSLELPKIKVIPIKDTQADRQYELYIKLPEEYSDSIQNRYPVIYYTDAMWHVEILSGSAEFIMENAILVGISWQKDINEDLKNEVGEHVSRYRDYTIRKTTNQERQAKYQFGQAANHLAFIRDDVIKYVENNYRTYPEKRTYFGYSASGLFGAYILMEQPDTFKNYILGSPSLRGDIPHLSKLGSNTSSNAANVFVTNGTEEEELNALIKEFAALLKNKNDQSLSLQHEVIEGSHQTAFPMTAVNGIIWLSNLMKE
ncbi:MAG: alpha/beta hydrolase-fold protein [Cyclobacteriaceae bacterium]